MSDDLHPRLRAVCDMHVESMRGLAGRHEYDGQVQDLSPEGVSAGLARLGGAPLDDPLEDRHVAAFEADLRATYGTAQAHRWNPAPHLWNLDVTLYERTYAPAEVRAEARRRHLAAWPDAIDRTLESLTDTPSTVAAALLAPTRGLAAGLDADADADALRAHARLVARIEELSVDGRDEIALGADVLAELLGAADAVDIDLAELTARGEGERDRLRAMLEAACAQVDPDVPVRELVPRLLADHPDAHGVIVEAQRQVDEVVAFTREHDLVPFHDGECLVGPSPESMRSAMAMMAAGGPFEDDAPAWYWVTPPELDWPRHEQDEWLQVYSATTLPAITVHEVAPGHFSHARALRRVASTVGRTLQGYAFTEGWAHYCEEMVLEVGFRGDDPRYRVGVALEALVRVTRLLSSLGIHTGALSVEESTAMFAHDAFLEGPAARAEALRATYDPAYGRYTWGKLEIVALRERARSQWGQGFSLPRFHAALLSLGAPPIGLLDAALTR
ncbi:MAG TPA: DUF885 family protein [Candidatus Nanopelagicales bacterium]|nr:DUF885 family protein [Candidatus Nanopelagicales bacterium]